MSYQFVLQTVTKGYRIEFTGNPPRTMEARCTPIPRNQARRGLESMLEKRVTREIHLSTDIPGFYSPIFLVAKESGSWRPILNLKAFNKFVKPPPFRMETLRTVMDCLGEAHQQRLKTSEHLRDSSMSETWAVSIDLRDAYLVERQRDLTLFWVNKLGFLVNEGKSQLIPTQFPAFLGSTLDLINMLIFPSEKRVVKVSRLASSLLARSPQPAKTWQKLSGHLSSLPELVPMAVTHTRHIQLMLHSQWMQVSDSPYIRIYPDHESLRELEWWASRANLTVGRPFLRPDPTMTIVTNASMEGWGGHLGDLGPVVVGLGQTPHQLARAPGNMADLAAFPASGAGHCCGCPYGQFHHSGLYKQGGWNSVPHLVLPGTGPMGLVQATRDLPGCQPHIRSQERPGRRPVQVETQPPHGVVPPQDSGTAHIRALADPPCGSLRIGEESQTSGVLLSAPLSDVEHDKRSDAELGESVVYGYAYPPTNLIPRVLRKLRLQWSARIVLLAQFWPSHPWFHQLTSMLTDLPQMITPKDNLLKNLVTGKFYPKPDRMRLAVWPLSANPSLTEGFHRELQRRPPGPGKSRLAGFMIPIFSTTDDGAWSEVWVPLGPL